MNKFKNLIKKINFKSKKTLSIIALLLIIVIGITYALYSSGHKFDNKFKLASAYDVQIREEFYGTWGTKKVTFYNNDQLPVVIRVSYNEMWKSSEVENRLLYLSNKVNIDGTPMEVVTKNWTDEWNNDFVLGNDGWYYYKKVLTEIDTENSEVTVLNSIDLIEEIKDTKYYNDYLQSKYELDFNFEAIQASPKDVKDIWGHVITIENGNISWPFE